ncbi:hypothetical protein [Streptomyces sp. NBC_00073]|uniref:hypothetical protein n=1 Tax=Streptomyces sp. NBC_00073 TaxID=2975640 RepID=UPI002F91409D
MSSQQRPKKRRPNHFAAGGASLVQNLLAGADDVAGRSFIGGGAPAATESDDAASGATPSLTGSPSLPHQAPAAEAPAAEAPAAEAPAAEAPAAEAPAAEAPAAEAPAAEAPAAEAPAAEAPAAEAPAAEAPAAEAPAAEAPAAEAPAAEAPAAEAPAAEAPAAEAPAAEAPAAEAPAAEAPAAEAPAAEAPAAEAPAAEAPAAEAPAAEAPAKSRGRAKPKGAPTASDPEQPATAAWAHEEVRSSYADARLRGSAWAGWGFRISPSVKARLEQRIKSDRRSLRRADLAIGHYLDAAIRRLPSDVNRQIEMAEAFGFEQLWSADKDRSKPSTYRVGPVAYELVSNLNMLLQEADKGRRGTLVISAGLQVLLDALDSEGALTLPTPPSQP